MGNREIQRKSTGRHRERDRDRERDGRRKKERVRYRGKLAEEKQCKRMAFLSYRVR